MIERVPDIVDLSVLFVKRDPGFNLTDKEFNHVIRVLEREQRIRSKPRLEGIENSTSDVVGVGGGGRKASNYQKLVEN